jgi:hypothetical protein
MPIGFVDTVVSNHQINASHQRKTHYNDNNKCTLNNKAGTVLLSRLQSKKPPYKKSCLLFVNVFNIKTDN